MGSTRDFIWWFCFIVIAVNFLATATIITILIYCYVKGGDPGVILVPAGDGILVPVPTR